MSRAASRKQVEAQSVSSLNGRESRQRRSNDPTLRSVMDRTPTATFIFSGEKIRFVNPAAEALTGYMSKELLRMDFRQLIHTDDREMIDRRGSEITPRYELKILRKDGAERWLDYSSAPIKFRGRMAVIGTAMDITDRKLAEERSQRNLAHQRLIQEATLASMSTLDLKGVLAIFLDKVDALLPCPAVTTIRVIDTETGALIAKALRHMDETEWERWGPQGGQGLTKTARETKSPVFVAEALKDPRTQYPDFFAKPDWSLTSACRSSVTAKF